MYSYFRCDNASFIDYQAIKDCWKSTTLSNIKEFVLSNDWIFSIFFDQSCVISIIRAISFIGVFWQKINCSPFALLAHLLGGWGDEEAKQTGRIKSNSLPINFCQLFKSSLSVVEMIVLFAKMIQCHETYGASQSDDSSEDIQCNVRGIDCLR